MTVLTRYPHIYFIEHIPLEVKEKIERSGDMASSLKKIGIALQKYSCRGGGATAGAGLYVRKASELSSSHDVWCRAAVVHNGIRLALFDSARREAKGQRQGGDPSCHPT
jgi:hypothetical protein